MDAYQPSFRVYKIPVFAGIFKWAVLDLNQRPPPCKLGQRFPGGYCPVGKSRINERFLPFRAPSFSCSVWMRPALVAARLQHLTLLRPVEVDVEIPGK